MQPKPNTSEPVCIPRDIMLRSALVSLGDIEGEIQAGYNILRNYHKTVTIFGSARTLPHTKYYDFAQDLGRALARHHYAVITGGGHGIMEAANRGAFEAGGDSIGFNIQLPHEQSLNEYTTASHSFEHFSPRKIIMTMYADAYVYFPGGFGTLDELTEIVTLMQTGKTNKVPIILFGSDYWKPFDEFVKSQLLERGLISPGDQHLYHIVDTTESAMRIIRASQTYCNHDI